MVFIAVGTQTFQLNRLLKAVDDLIVRGVLEGEVFAQIGHSDYVPQHYAYKDFLSKDDFHNYISNCDLLITHGGVATIVSALKLDKRVVVYPRLAKFGEHVDDHQFQIAETFSSKNLVTMCKEKNDLAEIVRYAMTHPFSKYVSQREIVTQTIRDYLKTI